MARERRHLAPSVRASNKPLRVGVELALLPGAARRAQVDLLHSFGTTSPLAAGVPSVVTILDLIYEHFPTAFPRLGTARPQGARRAWRPTRGPGHRHLPGGQGRRRRAPRRPPGACRRGAARIRDGSCAPWPRRHRICAAASALRTHASSCVCPRRSCTRTSSASSRRSPECAPRSSDLRLVIAGHPGRETERLVATARTCTSG